MTTRRRVPGGDVNDAYRVETDDGSVLFVKTRADPPPGMYAAEAAGLRWLAAAGAVRVPAVVAVADDEIALEWIDAGSPGPRFDEELGRGLALLHRAGAERCGFEGPTFIGPLRFPNGPADDCATFYANERLIPAAEHAGLRSAALERVCERIPALVPEEPPARLHGDLWTGNVMADAGGHPVLVDPAAYGGHREIDLAMLHLFGSPSVRLMAAYEEVHPLAPGHEERRAVHQLLPLLVHAALFGGSYVASVERIVRRLGS